MATPQWKTPTGMGAEHSSGFDKDAVPPWLMIAPRGEKYLALDFAVGKVVKSINPNIADITDISIGGPSRLFKVTGKLPGRRPARIEVRDPRTNRLEAALDVSVKNQRPMSISFHFVEDKAGDTTNRKFEDAGDIIRELNKVYTPQTNIKFRLGRSSLLKVDIDLGDVIDARTNDKGYLLTGEAFIYGKQMWKKIFATKADRMAHFNVYFVPTEKKDNRNDLLFYEGDNCVIEDGSFLPEFVLAHGIGRMFGCAPTSNPAQMHHLMYWGPATTAWFTPREHDFIPKDCANLMNP